MGMFDEHSVDSIERKMNVTTQRYLIGQNQYNRAMVELHEGELVLIWIAMLLMFGVVMIDNNRLRREVRNATQG